MKDYKGWAHGLKKAGYATNPRYGNILVSLIEKYELYRFDQEYAKSIDVDSKIKYAFEQALNCKFPETIKDYNPLAKPTEQESIAMYHVENIVFVK